MAKITIPERVYTADDMQAAVEAALREAAARCDANNDGGCGPTTGCDILTLIPSGPSALDRAKADAEARGMERAAEMHERAWTRCDAVGLLDECAWHRTMAEHLRVSATAIRAQGDAQRCAECDCQHGGNDSALCIKRTKLPQAGCLK